MRRPGNVRTTAERWVKLSALLISCERAMEASARLDAYEIDVQRHPGPGVKQKRHGMLSVFNQRLRALEIRIDKELDRLTSDRLRTDLYRKMHQAVA